MYTQPFHVHYSINLTRYDSDTFTLDKKGWGDVIWVNWVVKNCYEVFGKRFEDWYEIFVGAIDEMWKSDTFCVSFSDSVCEEALFSEEISFLK